MQIVVLAGGVGAARFLAGLVSVTDPEHVTAVVNVGDDFDYLGLRIAPDLDTILYTLGGLVHPTQGWGRADESKNALAAAAALGAPDWFFLGDKDIGLHLVRTERLRSGEPLSTITGDFASRLGIGATLLPSTDDPVTTMLDTPAGTLDCQTYFVRRGHAGEVDAVRYEGAADAMPAEGVLDAIATSDVVIVAPSNPFLSIGPILAIPHIADALAKRDGPVAAVSPVIGGRAVKGPADRLLRRFCGEATPVAVAERYRDFITHMLIDSADQDDVARLEAGGVHATAVDTLMVDAPAKARVATAALELVGL